MCTETDGVQTIETAEEILAEVTRTLEIRFGKTREKALYREAAMRS